MEKKRRRETSATAIDYKFENVSKQRTKEKSARECEEDHKRARDWTLQKP